MDLNLSSEDRAFREQVRAWLHDNVPLERCPPPGTAARDYMMAWQRRQHDAGWAGISWPREYGGRGLSLLRQIIWYEEYARAEAPWAGVLSVGLNHAGPTLMTHGDEAHKQFHLPRILRGDILWCQGFSEPGAGSDLASLRTRGTVEGDDLVVNGHKIWSSFAYLSDYQELLIRTDPDSRRHTGLSWVICDLRLPGITIRPIRTMGGELHFCEVFYDNVRIPLDQVVGGLGNGWRVGMATLNFERGTGMMADQIELSRKVERLVAWAREHSLPGRSGRAIDDGEIVAHLADLRAGVASLRALAYMTVSRAARQPAPGPESAMVYLFHAELAQRVYQFGMDLMWPETLERAGGEDSWTGAYLRSFKHSIAGGTSEIRRDVVGERVLGLPRSR